MQLFIKWQPHRRNQVNILRVDVRPVVRADQLDLVARFAQTTRQLAHRPRDAVDLWKIRFSDERDTHGSSRAWVWTAHIQVRVCPNILTGATLSLQAKRESRAR